MYTGCSLQGARTATVLPAVIARTPAAPGCTASAPSTARVAAVGNCDEPGPFAAATATEAARALATTTFASSPSPNPTSAASATATAASALATTAALPKDVAAALARRTWRLSRG